MKTRFEIEKEEAKKRYEELLAALAIVNAEHRAILSKDGFKIHPDRDEFDKMYHENSPNLSSIEFISTSSKAIFKVENRFVPHAWIVTFPVSTTKAENNAMRDLIFETLVQASSKNQQLSDKVQTKAPTQTFNHEASQPHEKVAKEKDHYKAVMIIAFSEHTPREEIFENVEAAEKRGIEIAAIFIGEGSALHEIVHSETKPSFRMIIDNVKRSDGGRKGLAIFEEYRSTHKESFTPRFR